MLPPTGPWTGPWTGLLARLVVGGVWLYAGALKLGDPEASVAAVRGYQILPTGFADTVGHVLPMLEVVLGACLVLGLLTRFVGGLSALMQLAFVIGIASVWSRGIEINCGCFGDGGPNPNASASYPWEIARDLALMAASVLLVVRPRTPYAVDAVLFPNDAPHALPQKQVDHVHAEP
ncbi:MAG: DoxX family rane protein [Marmoricola sp.]|nr:DoxX family rane protein [Marmoricola sp.]